MVEHVIVRYGEIYIVREQDAVEHTLSPHVRRLLPIEQQTINIGHKKAASKSMSQTCNVACVVWLERYTCLDTMEKFSVSDDTVGTKTTMYTIFGNVNYIQQQNILQVAGMRSPRHIYAILRILRYSGSFQIRLHRVSVDSCIGFRLQVSLGCFIERTTEKLFPLFIKIRSRTEDQNNIVLMHINDVGKLLLHVATCPLLQDRPRNQSHDQPHVDIPLLADAKANLQITSSGHVKIRYHWEQAVDIDDETHISRFHGNLLATSDAIAQLLRCLC